MNNIIKKVKRGVNKTVNKIDKVANNVEKEIKSAVNKKVNLASKLIFNNPGLAPYVHKILKRHGDKPIYEIKLCRSEVPKAIRKLMIKLGNAKDRILYHLYIIITLHGGKQVLFQKNERIDLMTKKFPKPAQEMIINESFEGITLNSLIDGSKEILGPKRFLNYNASSSNCQHFIQSVVNAGKLMTPERDSFIKQDTTDIFKDSGKGVLRKFANTVVNQGASRGNIAMNGGTLEPKPKRALNKWQIFYMAYAKEHNLKPAEAMKQASIPYKKQK